MNPLSWPAAVRDLYETDFAAHTMGVSVVEISTGQVVLAVTPGTSAGNGHGIVHGGVLFALADTAFAYALASHGTAGVTTNATISFLRAARVGASLTVTASQFHFDGTTGIYDVLITDEAGAALAAFRGQGRIPRARP